MPGKIKLNNAANATLFSPELLKLPVLTPHLGQTSALTLIFSPQEAQNLV
jgi:hypothetical protein